MTIKSSLGDSSFDYPAIFLTSNFHLFDKNQEKESVVVELTEYQLFTLYTFITSYRVISYLTLLEVLVLLEAKPGILAIAKHLAIDFLWKKDLWSRDNTWVSVETLIKRMKKDVKLGRY